MTFISFNIDDMSALITNIRDLADAIDMTRRMISSSSTDNFDPVPEVEKSLDVLAQENVACRGRAIRLVRFHKSISKSPQSVRFG